MANKHLLVLVIYIVQIVTGDPSVIIIGAGPAGIAAATRLLEHKVRNVLLLEAENRIGGRVNSVYFGEAYIDLGAEWCHGEKDNIVYDMVKDLNILGHTDIPSQIYHSSKKEIDQEVAEEILDIIDEIYAPSGDRDLPEGVTVGEYCIQKYNTTIHEKFHNDPKNLEIAQTALDLFQHYVLSSEGSFSWFQPSAKNDYRDCEGDLNLNWNGLGYKTALEIMMKKFPTSNHQLPIDNIVLLNKEVIKIAWNNSISQVKCADGSTYVARHIIFTPSIGVLKDQHQKIFSPSLPYQKQQAIQNIGFDGVMKIAMHFKKPWWNSQNFSGINFIWNEDDVKQALKEFPEGPNQNGSPWITEIFCLLSVEHNPNVLIAWVTGKMTPDVELLSNQTVIQGLNFVMNKFLGYKFNISEPDSIVRSSWCTNPHFKGTYSYQTIDGRKLGISAEEELAKPILDANGIPLLQFAGEATHSNHYSTVHGAIETGYREADRILTLYKKYS